jgi:hypothetical protein
MIIGKHRQARVKMISPCYQQFDWLRVGAGSGRNQLHQTFRNLGYHPEKRIRRAIAVTLSAPPARLASTRENCKNAREEQ